MEELTKAVTLTIELDESDPIITRTLRVPMSCTFAQLHDIIQTTFGWMDYHLYAFTLTKHALILEANMDEDIVDLRKPLETKLASHVCLSDVLEPKDTFIYEYDMGDGWQHNITVGEIVTQAEDYPVLVSWKENNACEDAGGIYGFYEKQEIINDPHHPEHEFMVDWMEMQHIDFDPEIVREELQFILKPGLPEAFDPDDIDDPLEFLLEALDEVFDLVMEDTLFIIDFLGTTYYVWFHDGDETRNIRIFESKEDCALACLDQSVHELIHPLFTNALILDYPDYEDEYDDEPSYTYRSFGKEMELEDVLDFTARLCDLLCPLVLKIEEEIDLDYFPDYHEEQAAVHIAVDQEGFVEVNTIDFPMKLEVVKSVLSEAEQAQVLQSKVNTEALTVSIFPIPNLLHDEVEEDYVFAMILKGKRTQTVKIFERKDLSTLAVYIKEELLEYMLENGKPKHLYCDDERVRMMLHELCKSIKLPLDYKRLDSKLGTILYDIAMEMYNDSDLFDPEYLSSLDDRLSELESMDEAKLKPILKKASRYVAYIDYLADFDMDAYSYKESDEDDDLL